MGNIPAYFLLIIYVVYLFVSPVTIIFWPIFFLIGLIYAVFTLHYWKKHQEAFNIYVSLGLLVASVALFGFTFVDYLMNMFFSSIIF
ncbi:hypothetical protein FPQ10_06785 [Allobacillus sp. SKP2-8]|uniref:hypothetical protein n=1 Tax=unclassified Allobacillus TaxID=2628859 RepID=UPI0011824B77|nr:hypothetical protein [Allobacillus sp. SKP2-8]TSJ66548.1 hypothetical protein FPQ10_06785 [Allobacillus sp. SKP2-8]